MWYSKLKIHYMNSEFKLNELKCNKICYGIIEIHVKMVKQIKYKIIMKN